MQKAAYDIQQEIDWFESVVDTALTLYFKNESELDSVYGHPSPDFDHTTSTYAKLIHQYNLDFDERLVLILALVPHIKPQSLDVFLTKNQHFDSEFSEFGGYKGYYKAGFFPTLETACFILGGYALKNRFTFLKRFNKDHLLYKRGILVEDIEQEFGLHQKLLISNEYLGLIITGKEFLPQYGAKFPAKEIMTKANWDDLIVDQNVMEDLTEIKDWLLHSELILDDWGLNKVLKPGYRVLFYGPSGTGKTMAASLLGKATNRPVFRVDLCNVVSKYIGETEKNLGRLFDEAEHKNWILFFDEADALFGKRTSTKGANDKYANQEVAYLLQRIEDFSGLVVLATNIQTNIDEAFSRRFQTMVHFPKPGKVERKLIWERLFGDTFELEDGIDFEAISGKYELTGGEMINVLRYCSLEAAKRNERRVVNQDIISGVRREYNKQNKTI